MDRLLRILFYCWIGVTVGLALTWSRPLAAQAQNGITSPTAGATVSGVVEVMGVASTPNFRRIEIYLLPAGEEGRATFVGRINSEANGLILAFDSTKYADGDYLLRMRVVRTDFNYSEYQTPLTIRNTGVKQVDRNGITAIRPSSGATVSGPIRISGVAYDPNFRLWRLELLPGGQADKAILLVESDSARLTAGTLAGLIDTTQYPDGSHVLRLRVIRADKSVSDYQTPLIIDNRAERTAAQNGISAPTAGQVLSDTVRITGVADHPQFSKWQLDLLTDGDPNQAHFLQWSAFPSATSAQLVRLDTHLFPDGQYTLRLRVVRKDGNYDEFSLPVVIANH